MTAAILNQADGAARFTIDDREGLLAGTLRSGERAYRIVSIDRDAQAVYALADSTSALRKSMSNAAAAASSLERRHVQLEVLSQITPSRVRMARNDLSLSIEGGDLGSLNTVTVRSVLRVLQQLQPLTNASGSEKIRIVNTEAGRIRFEQLINGIPVVRRNELIINSSGKILRIRSSIVDSSWAPTGEILATDKASDIALQTLARRLKTKRTDISVSAPPRLSYAVDGPNRALIPRYAFSLQHESGRTYEITVHAITGEAAVDTAGSQALGDDFLTYVYKRISGSPTSGGGFETELIWRETTSGGQVCPWAGGPGSYRCTSYADAQLVFTTANELSRNWESITAADPINRCCEILGFGDVVSIILDTPAAINGASFNTTSKAILFGPTGPTNMAYITDVLIHEFMHAYWFDYNFENYQENHFGRSLMEGLGDVMSAAYKLKHPGGTDLPWIWGDSGGSLPVNLRRDMTVDRDFSYVDANQGNHHEAGKAFGNYFYRLYRDSGMSADRLMLLTLVVADEVNDAEGDGLDIEDFQEAVFAAVAYTESALFNQVLSTWLSMNPSPNPIPSPPALVDGSPLHCSGGFSYYTVFWSPSSNTSAYGGYLRDPNGVTYTQKHVFSQDTTASVAFANYNTDAKFSACNGSGCSGLSLDSFPMPHFCF